MQQHYVYLHRRSDTGQVFYVGKGKGDRAFRATSRNRHWRNIVAKAGDPLVEFALRDADEELALLCEVELIDRFRRLGLRLCNMTDGGEGVSGLKRKQSAEEIERRRAANTGKKRTEEQRARIAAAKRGHGVGLKHSEQTKAKMAAKRRGRPNPQPALRGKTRPSHVVAALRAANDARFADRRQRLTAAIRANPDATLREIAEISGCDREMVAKYRRLVQAGEI